MKGLIGLTGRTSNGIARCGKDTVADMIRNMFGWKVMGFSDPLYDMIRSGFGFDGRFQEKSEEIPWLSSPHKKVTLRTLLETLGTEWGRDMIHPEVWLQIARRRYLNCNESVVFKDLRFENEAKWIRESGGLVIHIFRLDYVDECATKNHISNTPLTIAKNDAIIHNNSTIQSLEHNVWHLLKGMEVNEV